MGTRLFKSRFLFVGLLGLILTGLMAKEARAESITFYFTAHVVLSEGTDSLLGGPIPELSVLDGSMTFDTAAVDSNLLSTEFGEYHFSAPPNGIIVHSGGYVFQTDSNNVNFNIDIEDGVPIGTTAEDHFLVESVNNLFPAGAPAGDTSMHLNLRSSNDFMSSDALPTTPPSIQTEENLLIIGGSGGLHIVANLTSLSLTPPPPPTPPPSGLITFNFTANVVQSIGTENLAGGPVPNPSTLKGSMTFDAPGVDLKESVQLGLYHFSTPPNGITVQAGSNAFQTDPNNVNFSIDIEDGVPIGTTAEDHFLVHSTSNLFPAGAPAGGNSIDFNLRSSNDLMPSDALPDIPPSLLLVNGDDLLIIDVGGGLLHIVALLTSLTLPPTVESTLNDLKNDVAGIKPENFKNSNMGSALIAKIDDALAQLALIEAETDPALKAQEIADLRNKLINDILARGDGCGSVSDKNDWLTSCSDQASFQALVRDILKLLNAL